MAKTHTRKTDGHRNLKHDLAWWASQWKANVLLIFLKIQQFHSTKEVTSKNLALSRLVLYNREGTAKYLCGWPHSSVVTVVTDEPITKMYLEQILFSVSNIFVLSRHLCPCCMNKKKQIHHLLAGAVRKSEVSPFVILDPPRCNLLNTSIQANKQVISLYVTMQTMLTWTNKFDVPFSFFFKTIWEEAQYSIYFSLERPSAWLNDIELQNMTLFLQTYLCFPLKEAAF